MEVNLNLKTKCLFCACFLVVASFSGCKQTLETESSVDFLKLGPTVPIKNKKFQVYEQMSVVESEKFSALFLDKVCKFKIDKKSSGQKNKYAFKSLARAQFAYGGSIDEPSGFYEGEGGVRLLDTYNQLRDAGKYVELLGHYDSTVISSVGHHRGENLRIFKVKINGQEFYVGQEEFESCYESPCLTRVVKRVLKEHGQGEFSWEKKMNDYAAAINTECRLHPDLGEGEKPNFYHGNVY